ncbi:MAG: carbon storage regulator [Planctomycetaceae bacterium]|nr:MAG: carbon storage regulator [Planctomycetaceae bacterium]
MLVLSRKLGERIVIEPGIEIAVVEIRGGKVRLGIEAPRDISIRRMELDATEPASKPSLVATPR